MSIADSGGIGTAVAFEGQAMLKTLRKLWNNLRHPVYPELRGRLSELWAQMPEELRTPQQMVGRYSAGCSATIGVMPKCDFTCTGCYLGEEANRIPRLSVAEIKQQMDVCRKHLGPWGNIQLTDGEVTLIPADELVELIRYALSIDLIPMVMTHGDTFVRRPGLLERLVVEGNLAEVSIHIDVTQHGRRSIRAPQTEAELMPVRDQFAQLVRDVRRKTGKPLRAVASVTIVPQNLNDVAAITEWHKRNVDVFSLVSFQPIAQVGRTLDGLGDGIELEILWDQVAQAIYGSAAEKERLLNGWVLFGHPGCSRYVPGTVAITRGEEPRYVTLHDKTDPRNDLPLLEFMKFYGGLQLRSGEALPLVAARFLGMGLRHPLRVLFTGVPFLSHLLRRFDAKHPWRFAWNVLTGRTKLHHLSLVSHHFMSRAVIETPVGRERLEQCIFRVPIDGKMVSMCEVNALGVREKLYERMRGVTPARTEADPVTSA
jgi:hypothetical protein